MQEYADLFEPVAEGLRHRGRPRAFDRGSAVAAATRLFWEKGYEATSIADLAKAMGIGSPSLYAAFGSKAGLYQESLRHYLHAYEGSVWARFRMASKIRDAIEALLIDSAKALTGPVPDLPRGCMVTLSSVAEEGHVELGTIVRRARAVTLDRLRERISQAAATGEIAAVADVDTLARFIQTVQTGMSILARDGVTHSELSGIVDIAMASWDDRTRLSPSRESHIDVSKGRRAHSVVAAP